MKLHIIIPVINCLELTKGAIESIKSSVSAQITLIDNESTDGTREWFQSLESPFKLNYIYNAPKKGVAESWNQGVKVALEDPECEYIAILNNDIILHPKTLDHLREFMVKSDYLMVTADNIKDRMSPEVMLQMELPNPYTDFDLWPIGDWRAEGPDFSCFMISPETIRIVGFFDENFRGAYCEDQDYHARISRARKHIEEHNDFDIDPKSVHAKRLSTAPYYHYASQSLVRNIPIRNEVSINHGRNQSYYVRKWGGEHPWVMDGNGNMTPFGDATKNWREW